MTEKSFGLCENTKSHAQSSRIFITEKRDFESSIQDRLTENSEIMFFEYLTKNITLEFQGLWQLCVVLEKSQVDPTIQLQPTPKTMFL